jgi:hypothetical protein
MLGHEKGPHRSGKRIQAVGDLLACRRDRIGSYRRRRALVVVVCQPRHIVRAVTIVDAVRSVRTARTVLIRHAVGVVLVVVEVSQSRGCTRSGDGS